jgi:hypothetical protein
MIVNIIGSFAFIYYIESTDNMALGSKGASCRMDTKMVPIHCGSIMILSALCGGVTFSYVKATQICSEDNLFQIHCANFNGLRTKPCSKQA